MYIYRDKEVEGVSFIYFYIFPHSFSDILNFYVAEGVKPNY